MTAALRVLALHHLQHPLLGYAAGPLLSPDVSVTHLDLRRGEQIPDDPTSFDAIISWGGEHSVRDRGLHKYLEREREFLRSAVLNGIPVLGICLGAQILAAALESDVRPLPDGMHIAQTEAHLAPVASSDPIFSQFDAPFPAVHWHEDYFDLPEGAEELLERVCQGCAAFRYGASAWGIQFHPEASLDALFQWWSRTALQAPTDEPAAAEVLKASVGMEDAMSKAADCIFRGFIRFAKEA